MFPQHVTDILQQLSYLSLIVIAPCTVYNTIQNIINGLLLKNHIALDEERFARVNRDLGKHESMINDARADNMAKWTDSFVALVRNGNNNHI